MKICFCGYDSNASNDETIAGVSSMLEWLRLGISLHNDPPFEISLESDHVEEREGEVKIYTVAIIVEVHLSLTV
jgi:hypothetical protein